MYKFYIGKYHLATFNKLNDLYDYAYFLEQSLSNNYSWDSMSVTEVTKRRFRKAKEIPLDWNTICKLQEQKCAIERR